MYCAMVRLANVPSRTTRDSPCLMNHHEKCLAVAKGLVLGAGFTMAACHHAELEEAAFDRSVEQRDTPRRGQAQEPRKFEVGSKDMYGPAGVAFLQLVAELRIEGYGAPRCLPCDDRREDW